MRASEALERVGAVQPERLERFVTRLITEVARVDIRRVIAGSAGPKARTSDRSGEKDLSGAARGQTFDPDGSCRTNAASGGTLCPERLDHEQPIMKPCECSPFTRTTI